LRLAENASISLIVLGSVLPDQTTILLDVPFLRFSNVGTYGLSVDVIVVLATALKDAGGLYESFMTKLYPPIDLSSLSAVVEVSLRMILGTARMLDPSLSTLPL